MVYESIKHGPKAVTPSVNTTMQWFSRPKFRVSGLKDTNGKGKFKRMFSFLFVDKESFWLRNRLLTNSTMFSSWRNAKCPVLKFIQKIHSFRQQSFGRLFKYIFCSIVKKITFLKGNCHVNDVQIFMDRNSAGFTTTFYLRKLIVHFFCIQILRTFRSFHFVIAFML